MLERLIRKAREKGFVVMVGCKDMDISGYAALKNNALYTLWSARTQSINSVSMAAASRWLDNITINKKGSK